ncbi:MAG: (d)CMP kinase [Clostridiales bacterium]|nr:MAG: (d)CMP kinase [Clostridiales bacterium]
MISIAIDGPSGAGKSTLAKALAKELGYIHTDTGALYRTVGLAVLRAGVAPDNRDAVIALLPHIDILLRYEADGQKIYLGGEEVSAFIRTNEISSYASKVSAIPEVRTFLLDLQRGIAKENNVIMDGRDIGTVILPNAKVKFFITVSDEERARRRHRELLSRGENISLEEVRRTMAERDKNDSTRKVAPAIPAPDAVFLDNTGDFSETVSRALAIIRSKTESHE